MNNYYFIKLKIGETWFYLRSVTWFKNFEPTFEPVFVTNIDLAGLFFKDTVKKFLEIHPDAVILSRYLINNKFEFVEVKWNISPVK
jgi:hypothetical protein